MHKDKVVPGTTSKTKIRYFEKLPRLSSKDQPQKTTILIHDQVLLKCVKGFKAWTKQFDLSVPVKAGESLKTLSEIDRLARATCRAPVHWTRTHTQIFVAGGGSVGDFGGFFASIFFRGVELIHVPTTWLAAVDSAHGGKTALNVLGVKNQLGTFYPAKEVWLVQDVFKSQAPKTIEDACGEVAKMALLDLKVWGSTKRKEAQPRLSPGLWPLLPHLIAAKLRFVIKDPQEKLGLRVFLNLGHTLGHALESHFHIGHGHAVRLGVFFSVWLSVEKKIMSQAEANKILLMLEKTWGFDRFEIHQWRRPSRKVLKTLIQRDKKMKAQHNIKFVALEKVGHPLVISVSVEELLDLIERYWTAD